MEQTRAQRQQLHNTMQAEVRAILTPEQQTRFDALRASQRERMERRGPRGGGARGFRGPRGQRGGRAVS
jgi:Spy/CpxP family protein refolding chaperone